MRARSTAVSPTTFPTPPRPIRALRASPIALALAYLVMVAFAALVLWMLGYLARDLMLHTLGRTVTAEVTAVHERRGWLADGVNYVATYRYAGSDEAIITGQSLIDWKEYSRMANPYRLAGVGVVTEGELDRIDFPPERLEQTPVSVVEIGPLQISEAVHHGWANAYRVSALVLTPAFALATVALYFAIVVRRRRLRWLYVSGQVTAGTVVKKTTHLGKHGVRYFGQYAFRPTADSAPYHGLIIFANQAAYDAVREGQTITVLFDTGRPKRNVSYEYGGYAWA